jgi:putative endonuclease
MPRSARSDPSVVWWVYLVRCANRRIYVGISPDPMRRFRVHGRRSSAHMRMNKPDCLLGAYRAGPFIRAVQDERAIKRLSHDEKEALASRLRETEDWAALRDSARVPAPLIVGAGRC